MLVLVLPGSKVDNLEVQFEKGSYGTYMIIQKVQNSEFLLKNRKTGGVVDHVPGCHLPGALWAMQNDGLSSSCEKMKPITSNCRM
jgi:hypothetical protein